MRHMAVWRWSPWLALGAVVSCTAPGGPGSEPPGFGVRTDAGAGDGISVSSAAICTPAFAEALPGRIVQGGDQGAITRTVERQVFVTDLFGRFRGLCGACHVDNNIGGFHATVSTFATIDLAKVQGVVEADDPAKFMPPPSAQGTAWSQRDRSATSRDPVVRLLSELEQWFAQGNPSDVFKVKTEETVQNESFALPEELARRQTNMGNCIPSRSLVATQQDEMDAMDARFAAMETFDDLPDKLADTDLITLDSGLLAQKGVISFAPAYPLWSEDSGKMRAIRVPRGTSVVFDKATQQFKIPPNTRFYKTFLKRITQKDGKVVWRKIETRLIVSRPDQQETGMPAQVQALFGTYAWNEDETEAVLVRDALRSGKPFADRIFTYVVDEQRYQQIVDAKPANLVYELGLEKNKGVVRHYAIPGKQRCVECHMGSVMSNFVLGFLPVQVRRRPRGEAGVYEDAGPDELNQLQRLIDYGVITGVSSPSDIRGLEEPQGTRRYRNQHELTAQAYLLGNCSHCHNPRGFPSVKSPELVDMLDFFPGDQGGIFQFPLDRASPLRRRGASQDIQIPYITPSLRDFPAASGDPTELAKMNGLWTPKWLDCFKGMFGMAFCDLFTSATGGVQFVAAPWRSLIYRNVDTPYIYADDFTIFPHMPRHSAGFDCRAPRFMAEWMISIPSLHKKELAEVENEVRARPFDTNWQPYEEVKLAEVNAGDPRYLLALQGVSDRLYEYRRGKRYDYCPDRSDILIPEALTTADPTKLTPPDQLQYADSSKKTIAMLKDGVPDRAHYVPSDLTDTPGDWYPRRGDWDMILPNPNPALASDLEKSAPWVLRDLRIGTALRNYVTTKIPFGVWQQKAGCDFTGVPTAQGYPARMKWMDNPDTKLAPGDHIYEITPGNAVFANICINCHGPQADSKGLLAEAISEMTGGDARVANFRDGILAATADKVPNIDAVFGPIAAKTSTPLVNFTADDWAARYLSWMALGGTQRILPSAVLKIISAGRVFGKPRRFTSEASANMLSLARGFCRNVLGWDDDIPFDRYFANGKAPMGWSQNTSLLDTLGDAEMWLSLCSLGNRPVVRVPSYSKETDSWTLNLDDELSSDGNGGASLFWGDQESPDHRFVDHYGKNPVMNHRGEIDQDGIRADNLMPVCVHKENVGKLKTPSGQPVPACPDGLFETTTSDIGTPRYKWSLEVTRGGSSGSSRTYVGQEQWAIRGAANAGIAVFLYLKDFKAGKITPPPSYDHCEQLKR